MGDILKSDGNGRDPKAISMEASAETMKLTPKGEIVFRGMKLENANFDFPITLNSRVEYWVDYFTGRGRGHFTKYLERSEFFIPFIQPLLKQNGLPEDLVYLAMIESGFNNHARSHAKAVGPWQFISATGKRYGMMVNWWVDERRDTRKSTMAAVEYLRDLNGMFQSWELAAAAYNAGESKVARAIRRYGVKDYWVITRHKFLRPETRDYVPKIIAAAIVAKNRTQFGFPASGLLASKDEAVAGDGEVVKVIKDDDAQSAKSARPAETIAGIIQTEETEYDDYEDAPEDLMAAKLGVSADLSQESDTQSSEPLPLAKPIPTPSVSKKGVASGQALMEFEVQSPADLLKVARAAGLSYTTVKSLNPELLRWCTPPTVSTYRIKLPTSVKDHFLVTYNHQAFPRKVHFLSHKIRRGETLAGVARHFGIRVDPISDLNGVSAKHPLRAGTQVLLPMPNDRSRSIASLEVRDPPERRRVRRSRARRARSENIYGVSYKKREAARKKNKRVLRDS